MSFNNLARISRPSVFKEVLGQNLTVQILQNSIKTGRTVNVYLFCGPRGTGKTTLSRLLAKAVNCENLIDNEPCNKCRPCLDIAAGRSLDVLEIDAASNRGIDNIRELRQNVNYQPSYCKYKVYIIDEVHMLTNESFNALLKTLEEPPERVKFILATTSPNKLPDTILSRCLRFDLKLINEQVIALKLAEIAKNNNFNLENEIAYELAAKSGGSLRDSLNLLDMLFNLGDENLDLEKAKTIFGWISNNEVAEILQALVNKNASLALTKINGLLTRGISASNIVSEMIKMLREVTLAKNLKISDPVWSSKLTNLVERYYKIAESISLTSLFLAFDLLVDLQLKLGRIANEKDLLEVSILKLALIENLHTINAMDEVLEFKPVTAEINLQQPEKKLPAINGSKQTVAESAKNIIPEPELKVNKTQDSELKRIVESSNAHQELTSILSSAKLVDVVNKNEN